jgi:competence protein ComEC
MRREQPLTFWQAPLVPVALAATAGVLADRWAAVPLWVSLAALAACLAAWAAASAGRQGGLALVYLWGSVACLGAAYHHWHREVLPPDDISHFATVEPRPVVLRGVLAEEPVRTDPGDDPLRSFTQGPATRTVLRASQLKRRDNWSPASGLARLTIAGTLKDEIHVGDAVEVVGRLMAPPGPANPGELDYASYLRDQRIGAVVHVREAPDAVRCLAHRSLTTAAGWLVHVRGWAHRTLEELLPKEQQGLAMALLLGEDWMLDQAGWEKYQRTGVIHALAISGQHLSILAAFLWYLVRPLQIRRRYAIWFVTLFLLGYALLTGGRPPVMRAAVTVCALCGAVLLSRPAQLANLFALAWLVVGILNPTDHFAAGCQLSFLAVAVLFWGLPGWEAKPPDPLEKDIENNRPAWERALRRLAAGVLGAYGITLAIWLVVAPLVAARFNLVSVVGIVIGPPIVLLTTVALLAGFLALLIHPLCWPLAQPFAWVTALSLKGCDLLVTWGEGWPGAYWYVPDVPPWWVWGFFVALFAGLTVQRVRQRWQQLGLAVLAWLCVGLVAGALRPAAHEFRCTFLAVGHGGCTVLEMPDGRTVLYDAGSLSGPDVARRQIAPYLWSRGIRRIDEVILSHADLDHFNGLPALLERFAVGQVTCTPTFADRETPGARVTLEALERWRIPVRVVHVGDRLTAGDVSMVVLHPPEVGPLGKENVRSMVLLVRHLGHSFLLTGDLEDVGQERLLEKPPIRVDVLQAPHHGSKAANRPRLARWARPRVVISCQGPPRSPPRGPSPFEEVGGRYLTTWEHGAVTLHSGPGGLVVETYRTAERWTVRPPS